MFNLDILHQDKELIQFCRGIIVSEFSELGRFIDIKTIDCLFNKLVSANYEKIKYLPIRGVSIYRTSDIGLGYNNYMSIRHLQEFIALGKINKDIPVYLDYKLGNTCSYIKSSEFNKDVLITDETYIYVKEDNNEIWDIKIGKPTNPNKLYYREDINNIKTVIDKIVSIENLNSIYVEEMRDSLL